MENLGLIDRVFWQNKRVFITGHTGFKGTWLSLWLHLMGAKVYGYALNPPTVPSIYNLCRTDEIVDSTIGDIRDLDSLRRAVERAKPDIVIHMAAQPLVRDSYEDPVGTYSTNIMGTINVFEAVRAYGSVKVVINITTDKCYENKEWYWGYREDDQLGGHDPYSNSKACSELITSSYRNSFFNEKHSPSLASARAGNVIGGGDWAKDRLIPDCIRYLSTNQTISIRNPNSIRPWQHVLEPLSGYLLLAQNLYDKNGHMYEGAWNFGPDEQDVRTVEWVVSLLCKRWGYMRELEVNNASQPHEARFLKLDCSKAKVELNWRPRWGIEKAIDKIIEWHHAHSESADMRKLTFKQIEEYVLNE